MLTDLLINCFLSKRRCKLGTYIVRTTNDSRWFNSSRYFCKILEHVGDKKSDSSVTSVCEIIVLR